MNKIPIPIIAIFALVIISLVGFLLFAPLEDTNLPRYRGDTIDNIGNDPFIRQVPTEKAEQYKAELSRLKNALTENPTDLESWLQVGLIKKLFNNYAGARDAWEYAKLINPKHSIAYYNLGDIYSGYLKDVNKAEENYLKAIEVDPALSQYYVTLALFYEFVYKEKTDLVDDVLVTGLQYAPFDESLRYQLIRYLREQGLSTEAINARLEQALTPRAPSATPPN